MSWLYGFHPVWASGAHAELELSIISGWHWMASPLAASRLAGMHAEWIILLIIIMWMTDCWQWVPYAHILLLPHTVWWAATRSAACWHCVLYCSDRLIIAFVALWQLLLVCFCKWVDVLYLVGLDMVPMSMLTGVSFHGLRVCVCVCEGEGGKRPKEGNVLGK